MLTSKFAVLARMEQGHILTQNHGDRCWWLTPGETFATTAADDERVDAKLAERLVDSVVIRPTVGRNMVQTTYELVPVPGVDTIKLEQVVQVYSGRPGCGCGCKGKYTTNDGSNPGQITRVLNTLKSRVDEVEVQRDFGDEYDVIYSLQDSTRYRWVYVKFEQGRTLDLMTVR